MCNILKFTQSSLVFIPYLLTYSQQCFVTTLLCHIVFMFSVLMVLIRQRVFRYSAHFKPRKTIKTIKTENITYNHKAPLSYLAPFQRYCRFPEKSDPVPIPPEI